MRLRNGKFVNMSRPSGNSSLQGVPPPHNNAQNVERQPIEMTVEGVSTSTTVGVTARVVIQTLVSTTTPEMMIPTIQKTIFPINQVVTPTTIGGTMPSLLPSFTLSLVVGSIHMARRLQ